MRWPTGAVLFCAAMCPWHRAAAVESKTAPVGGGISASEITPDIKPDGDPFEAARFTLELHGAPLGHMLYLLETTTGLRFHYAAPPDGVVYSSFNNAPLLPTLQEMLLRDNLWMHRHGPDVYLLPLGPSGTDGGVIPKANVTAVVKPAISAWRYWTGVNPPPGQWMFGTTGSSAHGAKSPWSLATVNIDTGHHPTFWVHPPATAPSPAPSWLNWPLTLRHRPEHMQLLLETAAVATLYVNGAPLLRRWHGWRLIDLGQMLQPGENNLALYWPVAPAGGEPLLRYEWFIAGSPQGTGAGTDGNAVIAGRVPAAGPLPPGPESRFGAGH